MKEKKSILKQLLYGTIPVVTAIDELNAGRLGETAFVMLSNSLYSYDGISELSESEMKAAVGSKRIWLTKIIPCNFPLASCERDVVL